ncbi:putative tail fiber protein [Burkholderia phage FLC6]|nr:putative tail fiber protein [Burkholderia phage FLC6]
MAQGYVGTLTQWLASLKGADGATGAAGTNGKSAYEVAVADGFVGDEPTWLLSLHGNSAYQDAVAQGFVGNLTAWLASLKGAKGDTGAVGPAGQSSVLGHLVGSVNTSADLPDPSGFLQADYFFVGTHVWMNLNGEWTDMGDFQGTPGKDGSGITVLGSLPSPDYLPVSGQRNGDAWLIGTVMYVWQGTTWQLQGQQGLKGDTGPVGPTGPQGQSAWDVVRGQHPEIDTIAKFVTYITGPQGAKGDTAISFVADGTVATTGDLPATGTNNHGYLVGDNTNGYDFWVWINSAFVNLGRNVGPKGDTGATGPQGGQGPAGNPMKPKGTVANVGALPSSGNSVGDSYGVQGHLYSWDGAAWVDMGNLTGPAGATGAQGPVGQPVNAKGSLANTAALPTSGNANGDAYEIGGFIYVYNSTSAQFVNMGQWRGANGTNGTNGLSAYQQAQAAGFAGTVTEWLASLKGADGVSFTYIGQFANAAALPTGTHTGAAATTADTNHIYLWDATNGWKDNGQIGVQGPQGLQGPTGADGKSAYDVAVAGGFAGTQAQWLASLKGLQGDSAYQVAVAQGFAGTQAQWLASLVGAKGDTGAQGTTGATGATGQSAYQAAVAAGFVGDINAWLASLKGAKGDTGAQGVSLAYIGDFANSGAIPAGTLSQVATAGGHIFINNGTTWVDAGPVAQGPQGIQGVKGDTGATGATGQSAYQAAVAGGFVGTQAQWLASLVGPTGASAVQDAIAAGKLAPGATINDYITLTTGPRGPAGADGATGPQGQTGPAISIIGQLSDSSQLPGTGTAGTGYAIPDSSSPGTYNCWIWLSTTSQWFNLGHVVGAQGPQGIQGLRGLQGLTGPAGPTGPQGTLWIVLTRDPQAQDGNVGDYFFNSNTQEFFRKTSTSTWASLGHIGGGNLNAPAATGKYRAYNDSGWVDLPSVVNALPTDNTGKHYVLSNGLWVQDTLIDTIPADTGTYIMKSGAWTRLDTYTLKAVDAAISAGAVTLDLNVARTFRIQNTAAAAITMTNLPAADRTTTVIVKIYGKTNAMTWTNTIRWFDGSAPPLTNSTTTVVLNWDGTEWVGSVPN